MLMLKPTRLQNNIAINTALRRTAKKTEMKQLSYPFFPWKLVCEVK